ncbi:aldehyde dehydrogenase family protein [candidate division KSB1 bacterium]|nr:aldehyde dehydrogenase family protein [candidate division KSB1 bacterium]
MSKTLQVISPVDNSVYVERKFHTDSEINETLTHAVQAQQLLKKLPVSERIYYINKFIDAFSGMSEQISKELSWQMGRPIIYGKNEVNGTVERAAGMIDLAKESLADIDVGKKEGFHRYIKREPLGVVFVVPAWNYPYLIAVNTIVPGLLAGNAIVLKHSAQTPLVAERFADAFKTAGLPEVLFQFLHLSHSDTAKVIRDSRIDFVAFTGSVAGGHSIQKVASERFIGVGLELGGKDPAYVRSDANLEFAIANLVDGAFYNSGQSCCGIERIYVHQDVYDQFVDGCVELTKQYKLGNPLDTETNLGPVAKHSIAKTVIGHINAALGQGARGLIDPALFPNTKLGYEYLAPQILVDVNHTMDVMKEETFGPVVGIMKVQNDKEAIELMNDSPYGLTASIWTEDEDSAVQISNQIATGTCFMNRCDYLDPYLAWTGIKDTGRGCTLSTVGYEQLTRPKSYHLRIKTQ